MDALISLVDLWIARRAVSPAAGRAAAGGLKPVAVVTGGSEGIGLAFARRLAGAGRDVALVARDPKRLEAAAQAIARETQVQVAAIALDITAPDAGERLTRELADRGHYVDVLVNNAGIGAAGPFAEESEQRLMELVDLNVRAATALMRHVLPGMLARGRGGVINVASLGAYTPGPNQATYYASKAYLVSLSEAVAEEIAGRGVRVCAVVPGPVNTAFHARMGARVTFLRLLMPPTSAARVAWSGWWGYRLGRRVVVPGVLNTALALAMRLLPHRLLTPLVAMLLKPRSGRGRDVD